MQTFQNTISVISSSNMRVHTDKETNASVLPNALSPCYIGDQYLEEISKDSKLNEGRLYRVSNWSIGNTAIAPIYTNNIHRLQNMDFNSPQTEFCFHQSMVCMST